MRTERSRCVRGREYRSGRVRRDASAVRIIPAERPQQVCLCSCGNTVAEMAEEWLASCVGQHKRSTYAAYQMVVDKHIRPDLGNVPVAELTRIQISSYLNAKTFGGDGQPALAPSTVCSIITVLRAVFYCAEQHGVAVQAWSALNRPHQRSRETSTLTEEEQQKLETFLWETIDTDKLGILLCLYTGLRIGELCALRWGDISEDGILTVHRTVQRIRNPDYGKEGAPRTIIVFDTPKSDSSRRSIPIPSALQEPLEQFRCAPDCFILTGDSTVFREPRTMQNRFKTCLKRSGVRDINFHALRHTFATNCVQLGFDPKTLSKILGHSTVGLTLNTYVHPPISVMRSMMERLSRPDYYKVPDSQPFYYGTGL